MTPGELFEYTFCVVAGVGLGCIAVLILAGMLGLLDKD